MNINDVFYIIVALMILSLVVFGYRMPLDDTDKKLLKEKD